MPITDVRSVGDVAAEAEPYTDDREYLADELERLESMIREKLPGRPASPDEAAGGRGRILPGGSPRDRPGRPSGPGGDEQKARGGEAPPEDPVRWDLRILERRRASAGKGVRLGLSRLAEQFGLSRFEEECLLLGLAPEIDRRFGDLFSILGDDARTRTPSAGLAIDLFCRSWEERLEAREALGPLSTLSRFRLLGTDDGSCEPPRPLVQRPLVLDDRVADFILGIDRMDAALVSFAQLILPEEVSPETEVPEPVLSRMRDFVLSRFRDDGAGGRGVAIALRGPYGSGKRSLVRRFCRDVRVPLLLADVSAMAVERRPFEETAWRLGREAALRGALLCLDHCEVLGAEGPSHDIRLKALGEVIEAFSPLAFLLGNRPWTRPSWLEDLLLVEIDLALPDERARRSLWERMLAGRTAGDGAVDLDALAGKFRFTPGRIRDAVTAAEGRARWRDPEGGRIGNADLHEACSPANGRGLGSMARKLPPGFTWEDLVLPEEPMSQLREICDRSRYGHVVYCDWGFGRRLPLGRGLGVLFSGPPGTGKTMAATVIAGELGLDLYRIDLSRVVSKYIGETEKNLEKIFDGARDGTAILLFDEADALFGKRSEVRDAHDRYANIETGYLLQKMEEFEGIAVLATNLRGNMDEAFVRRLHVIVDFPFPDEAMRKILWMKIFPSESPTDGGIDFDHLARRYKLSGGNIRNVALHAAFLAAAEGTSIGTEHIVRSLGREYRKMGGGMPHDLP